MGLFAFFCVLVVCVVFGKIITLAIDEANARQRRFLQDWLEAARAAGLDALQLSDRECRAQGLIQEVPTHASLKLEQAGKTLVYRSLLWAKSGSIPRQLSLHPDSTLRSMARWVEGQDVPIGDAEFDEQIELPAVDAHVCAALCYQARGQLTKLLGWGGCVEDGMVVCRSTWNADQNRSLTALLRSVAALGRLLSVAPGQLPKRLAYNALKDPAPEVRLQNLRFLLAPETQTPPELLASTSRSLLGDSHAPVRLLAAEAVGEAGHAVLRALAADERLDRSLRVQAVEKLGRHPSPDLDGLHAVLTSPYPPELTCAALSVLEPSSGPALLEAVLGCTSSPHENVRAEAARALGVLASPNTEPLLIQLLSDAASDVQQASAEALGVFGSIAAVEPLLPLAESLVRPRLRQTARGAIGRIQARLGDVEAGRVSLSDPNDLAGAVDVADTSAALRMGEVSLVEEDARRATPSARRGHAAD